MGTRAKAPVTIEARPTNQRVSAFDKHRKAKRLINLDAKNKRNKLDLEIAEAEANLAALKAERDDYWSIEIDTDYSIQGEQALIGQERQAPQLSERKPE